MNDSSSIPSSSVPLPLPTLQDERSTFFLEWLRTALAKGPNGGAPLVRASDREEWVGAISEFCRYLLSTLPFPRGWEWSLLHEKVKLIELCLQVVCRAVNSTESLFVGYDSHAKTLFATLIGLCNVLDQWCLVSVPAEEDVLSPQDLRTRAMKASVDLIQCLGRGVKGGDDKISSWSTLEGTLDECLTTCQNYLQNMMVLNFPLDVNLFGIHDQKADAGVFDPPEDADGLIVIRTASQLPMFLSLLVATILEGLHPPLMCQNYLIDRIRRAVNIARHLSDFVLSADCAISLPQRATSLSRILTACISFLREGSGAEIVAEGLRSCLLLYRLKCNAHTGWESVDLALHESFDNPSVHPCTASDTLTILDLLLRQTLTDTLQDAALSYLKQSLPCQDTNTKRCALETLLRQQDRPDQATYAILKELVRSSTQSTDDLKPIRNKSQWLLKVRTSVEAIVAPDSLSWMDDDDPMPRSQFATRALTDISNRFQRPLDDASANGRIALARGLLALSCIINHPDAESCPPIPSNRPGTQIMATCVPVILRLLEGSDTEVTNAVRQNVIDVLVRCMKHHSSGFGGGILNSIEELCFRNLKDRARNVRLSAGRLAAELVRVYQITDSHKSKHAIAVMNAITRLLNQSDVYKESSLIVLGYIAKVAINDMLGRAVCTIFSQLGKDNPAVKGTAFMQLVALSKYHNKSHYDLLAPYMSQIAVFAVSRMISHPGLLSELCRFISMDSPELIRHTLSDTLPDLIISRNVRVLEFVASEVGQKVSTLLLDYGSEILARALLLQSRSETDDVLNFIVKIMVHDTGGSTDIKIKNLVQSCYVALLASLVIVMGEEGGARLPNAIEGIKRVQRIMTPTKKTRSSSQVQTAEEYLVDNMLAVMTQLNEILHEMHGKKSVDSKRQIIRSLGPLISYVGKAIGGIGLQVMAALQTTLGMHPLVDVTLETWSVFLTTLGPSDIGPFVGATSAAFLSSWKSFSFHQREIAKKCLQYIVIECGDKLGGYLDEIAEVRAIPELGAVHTKLSNLRSNWEPEDKLRRVLERSSSDNLAIACQALEEMKAFMLSKQGVFVRSLAHGDAFSPLVGDIISTLCTAASRDEDNAEPLRLLAYTCIGIFGAVDPDRFELSADDPNIIMLSNFNDETEAVEFALHLIRDVLVGVFRSASDINYQTHVAFVIQELLKFCKFTPNLVSVAPTGSVPLKARSRWNSLPRHVLETITPFLESKYHIVERQEIKDGGLIYPNHATYRDWIQHWAASLLDKVSGTYVNAIFPMFHWIVVHKDAGIAHHLLPHLVLNVLISGGDADVELIRSEILSVLQDQVNPDGNSSPDKRLLSTQAIFTLMDHLNKWVRAIRQGTSNTKKPENRRSRLTPAHDDAHEQLLRVDSILSSINQNLVAKAALQCKAFARSLMNFERQILEVKSHNADQSDLQAYYEHLHEIYAHLDEPDGMEGVSTFVLSPSLEHQIRQHESTGRWTSAQSCWEVRLQQDPDNLEYHVGLLRCLRNLGHYDTLRTHVKGVLTRNPGWETVLAGFQVESSWMIGDWEDVTSYVNGTTVQSSSIVIARALLALRNGDASALSTLSAARKLLGSPITAAGPQGYRRCYEAVLDLHLLHELEVIDSIAKKPEGDPFLFSELVGTLSARLDATLPTFRVREPILSMRRTAFGLRTNRNQDFDGMIGRTWLASAKIARKAGHWQTAYSAMLQAQQRSTPFWFIANAKLIKANGEPLRALHDLDHAIRRTSSSGELDDIENRKMKGKALVLRARWMSESERFQSNDVLKAFQSGAETVLNWESGHFHLGNFQDECYKALSSSEKRARGTKMSIHTVRYFSRAIKAGSKYVYQAVPRLLTLWLDMGEDEQLSKSEIMTRMNLEISRSIETIPTYKWFTAFPQIASRVGHSSKDVFALLSTLICRVIGEYPKQALWLFTSVVKSTKEVRGQRGKRILDQLKSDPKNTNNEVPTIINECLAMTNELLALCDYPVRDEKKALSMNRDFPRLAKLMPSRLIIPLQESLTANFPPIASPDTIHQPFPVDAPTFQEFADEIEVMRSLAKPRKITIRGSNGQIYMFLGKPKDDLRKDARLMDFNAIINKLLKANMESRRRQLYIRTYGVVTLNEECGFIQWVRDTIPVRPVLVKGYDARNIKPWSNEMSRVFTKIKELPNEKDAAKMFVEDVLAAYPPVFHEWFLETFPEPSIWLSSRLAYSRTAAVMSMVGFILGLGDRHCENILLDSNTGDVVHVDFNCLFEKGKTLETPERVPFRLTQNMVDGLGVTGVEGVFRIACEITMQLLHDNRDCLMSVLDAFIHDPLMEWEDEKRRLDRDARRRPNTVRATVDLRSLAKNALNPIDKKLRCIYTANKERSEKEISTSNLVQILIQEATDDYNLARMYPGWAPYL